MFDWDLLLGPYLDLLGLTRFSMVLLGLLGFFFFY